MDKMLSLEQLKQNKFLDLGPQILLILHRHLFYKADLSHTEVPSSANTATIYRVLIPFAAPPKIHNH